VWWYRKNESRICSIARHAYNPSYSGGRDQENYCSKPIWANSSQDSKRAGGVAQGIGPEFKPQYLKKKKSAVYY
jgi:hypothetical protein